MRSIASIYEERRQSLYEALLEAGTNEREAARQAEIGAAEYVAGIAEERADRKREQLRDDRLTGDER